MRPASCVSEADAPDFEAVERATDALIDSEAYQVNAYLMPELARLD